MMGIQIAGVILMVFMGYITFVYYKKQVLTKIEAVFFIAIWGTTAVITLFPSLIDVLSQRMYMIRKLDLIIAVGIGLSLFLSFLSWLKYKAIQKQMEKLIDQKTETKWNA